MLRYVQSSTVYERFLTWVTTENITAEGLATLVCGTLSTHDVPISMCMCQNYDDNSVMSIHCAGVQSRTRELCPQVRYIHCYAHRLNLVLVITSKTIDSVRDFFSISQMLYVFLSSSAVIPIFEQEQKKLEKSD